jgi:hypothetical protein
VIAAIDRATHTEISYQSLDVDREEGARGGDEQQEQNVLGRHPRKVANKNGPP